MKIRRMLILLATIAPGFSVAAQNNAPTPPMMKTAISNDDYPWDAIRQNSDGLSQVEVHLDSRGHLAGCKTSGRSGSPILDVATCQLIRKRGSFTAALDPNGVPIPSEAPVDFVWRIRGHPYPARRPVDILVTVQQLPLSVRNRIVRVLQIQRADGSFESCFTANSSGSAPLDALACSTAASGQILPLETGGHPVRALRIRQVAFVEAASVNPN